MDNQKPWWQFFTLKSLCKRIMQCLDCIEANSIHYSVCSVCSGRGYRALGFLQETVNCTHRDNDVYSRITNSVTRSSASWWIRGGCPQAQVPGGAPPQRQRCFLLTSTLSTDYTFWVSDVTMILQLHLKAVTHNPYLNYKYICLLYIYIINIYLHI